MADTETPSIVNLSSGIDADIPVNGMYTRMDVPGLSQFLLALYQYDSESDYFAVTVTCACDTPGLGNHPIEASPEEGQFTASILWVRQGTISMGSPVDGQLSEVDSEDPAGELEITSTDDGQLSGTLRFRGEMVDMADTENLIPFDFEVRFDAPPGQVAELPGILGGSQ